jgi:hypothetical protein
MYPPPEGVDGSPPAKGYPPPPEGVGGSPPAKCYPPPPRGYVGGWPVDPSNHERGD